MVHIFSLPEVAKIFSKLKQKANKWTVNIEQGTLSDFKDYIRELYKLPVFENDGAVLNFMNNERKYYPRNDVTFQKMLQLLVSKNNLKFTVFIETPLKPFNKWTFPKVCQLYGLSDNPNPSIDVYPVFKFSCVDTKNEKYGEQGLAQATIQMESSLGHKRKAKEIDNEYSLDKVWEIVIDVEKWYFMKYTAETGESFRRIEKNKKSKVRRVTKAEFKRKNTEFLKANKKYNERYDAENAKLRVRIKEMESEFGDRITKVEQNQLQNDNSVTKQLPMVAHYEKPLVDKEMDTSLPEEPTPEVSPTNIPDSQFEQCKPVCKINNAVSKVPVSSKISEERETGLGYV
ncbi:hypothetical protein GLOIN_2v1883277 [Rhizophagus irregularis DAOM 181602=DAOM 197198]|nr:hypothetical protein GLOIN_2v1883277 [Rhizophagus irregularis DAOM 181602=DAOM 197198]